MTATITCNGDFLKQYVAKAYNIASKNSGDGVNSGIRLRYAGGALRLHATNMDVYYEGRFSAATDALFKASGDEGSGGVVGSTVLHKIMQSYKRGEMTITLGDTLIEMKSADGAEYELPVHQDSADFPESAEADGAKGQVPTAMLKAVLERIYPCLSQNPSQNYAITGASLRASPRGFVFAATDTAALIRVLLPTLVEGEMDVVIPRSGVAALETFHDEHITLIVAKGGVTARTASESMFVMPVNQDYPNVNALIDSLQPRVSTTIAAGELLDGLKRVNPVLGSADPVRFFVKSVDKLELQAATSGRGRAKIEVNCKSGCPNVETLFYPDHLIAFLRAVPGAASKVLTWEICAPLSNQTVASRFSVEGDILPFQYILTHVEA